MLVYIYVYMQVYLHVYIHICVQKAHNFDTFYKVEIWYDIYPDQETGHIEHMQNGNKIMSDTITCHRKLEIGYNDHR